MLDVHNNGLPNFDFDYIDGALTILRTALEIKNYYTSAFLSQVDLTPARLGLLMALFLCEDQAVLTSELAELMVVTPGNITGLVGGLAKDRLVRRVTYPGDRRAALIELTEKGRRLSAGLHRSTFASFARSCQASVELKHGRWQGCWMRCESRSEVCRHL